MTILWGGGEMGAGIPSDANVFESATSGMFDSAFARCAVRCNSSVSYWETPEWGSEDDIWLIVDILQDGATNDATLQNVVTFVDGAGVEQARLACTWNNTGIALWALQYKLVGVWTDFGTQFSASSSARQTVAIHIVCNSASGSGALYLSGTKRLEGTGKDLSAITSLEKARFYGKTTAITKTNYFSQPVIANQSLIGWRLKTVPATGAGATTDWTGGYTEIDEIVYSDVDFINSGTANQVELFSHSTTVPDGYTVRGVIVAARAKEGDTGPTQIQLALRSGGTTYFSSTQALDSGYGANVAVWETDPATAGAFTAASIAALQFGVKSIA